MLDLQSTNLNWQQSVQKKIVDEGTLDLDLGESDEDIVTFDDVNGSKGDEYNDDLDIEPSNMKTESNLVNKCSQNVNKENNRVFKKSTQGKNRRSGSQTKDTLCLSTDYADKLDENDNSVCVSISKKRSTSENQPLQKTRVLSCQDKLAIYLKLDSSEHDSRPKRLHITKTVAVTNLNLNQDHTSSADLQKHLFRPLKQKMEEPFLLLVPLIRPLKLKHTSEISKAEQSIKKGEHDVKRPSKSFHTETSLMGKRKTTVSERKCIKETSYQKQQTRKIPVVVLCDIGRSLTQSSCHPKSFIQDTNKISKTSSVVNDCEPGSVELKVLKCQECLSVFNDITNFDHHLIRCVVDAKKRKHCRVCRVVFPDLKALNTHDCIRVRNGYNYSCSVCKKVFKKRDVAYIHMKIHTSKKDFACEVCQKAFLHKHHLTNHMAAHKSDRPFKCQVCSAAFKRISHLQKHQTTHKPDTERKFKCHYCDSSFHDKYKLTRHEKNIHTFPGNSFVCDICKGSFKDQYILTKHLKTVHSVDAKKSCKKPKQQIECKICGMAFFWKRLFQNHMTSHGEVLNDAVEDTDAVND